VQANAIIPASGFLLKLFLTVLNITMNSLDGSPYAEAHFPNTSPYLLANCVNSGTCADSGNYRTNYD
jgi:hypothetical protein